MTERPWQRFYDDEVPRTLQYERLTLPELLDRSARAHADRPAILFQNGRLTYGELRDHVDRLATALAGMGVGKGDRVAIHAPNLPQTAIGYYATLRLGAIAVMTNPLYTGPELEHQWNDADVKVALTMDFLFDQKVRPIRDRLGIEHYVIVSIPEYLRFPLNLLAPFKLRRADPPLIAKVAESESVHRFKRLIESHPPEPPRTELDWDDVAMLQYTGGTTGLSKGAMLTHRNISCNTQQIAAWDHEIEPGHEVVLGALPIFHIYGLTVVLSLGVAAGGSIAMIPNPRDLDAILTAVVKHRVTLFPAVPALYQAINQHPDVGAYDLSSVKICNSGSAPLPIEVLHRFEELTGAKIAEGYGLTEASPVTHSNPVFGKRKPGSIGLPLPDTEVRIVSLDDGTTDVPRGEAGELLVRGPQVMKGYWKRPDETAWTIRDGWLHTGDIARMDEEGFFYIVGRVKDMILASGYNIYPDEIDRVLAAHPAVAESATIGVPDEKRGETVKSFVVLEPGTRTTEEELIAYCRENLAAYKIPRIIEFRDELPKSTVLKVLRRELREQEMARQG